MPWSYFLVNWNLHLSEVNLAERVDDLTDDVITWETIKAENDKVKGNARNLIVVDAVECKDLIEDWI